MGERLHRVHIMEDTVVMFRIKKGHHGYIKRKKCLLLGEVLGLLIGIIGLVVIGVVTTGSRKNLLTVVALSLIHI